MGLFSRKKNQVGDDATVFPLHTNTLNESGLRIVLNFLKTKPNGIEFTLEGDFGEYPFLRPEFRQIPNDILMQANTKSEEKLKEGCKQLGQLLMDSGIDVQIRNQGKYLQIETFNEENQKWSPAVIMHDKTTQMSQ